MILFLYHYNDNNSNITTETVKSLLNFFRHPRKHKILLRNDLIEIKTDKSSTVL